MVLEPVACPTVCSAAPQDVKVDRMQKVGVSPGVVFPLSSVFMHKNSNL